MKSLLFALILVGITYGKCLESGNWEYKNKRVSDIIGSSLCTLDLKTNIAKIFNSEGTVIAKIPLNGLEKRYSYSGILTSETPLVDGVRNGLAKIFFFNGNLMESTHFKNDKPIGVNKIYYNSGELEMEYPFKNGKPNGEIKYYYKSGALLQRGALKEGELVDSEYEYFESGALKRVIPYRNGKKNGIREEYYENSKLKSKTKFKEGMFIDMTYINEIGEKYKWKVLTNGMCKGVNLSKNKTIYLGLVNKEHCS